MSTTGKFIKSNKGATLVDSKGSNRALWGIAVHPINNDVYVGYMINSGINGDNQDIFYRSIPISEFSSLDNSNPDIYATASVSTPSLQLWSAMTADDDGTNIATTDSTTGNGSRKNGDMTFYDDTANLSGGGFIEPYWLCRCAIGSPYVFAIDLISTSDPTTVASQALGGGPYGVHYGGTVKTNGMSIGYNGTDLWMFFGHIEAGSTVMNKIAFLRYDLSIANYGSWDTTLLVPTDAILVNAPGFTFDGLSGYFNHNDDSFYIYYNINTAGNGVDKIVKYQWNSIDSTVIEVGTENTNLLGSGVDVNEKIPSFLYFGGNTNDGNQVFCGTTVRDDTAADVGGPEQYVQGATWWGSGGNSGIIIESFYNTSPGLMSPATSNLVFSDTLSVAGSSPQEITFTTLDTFHDSIDGFITFQTEIGNGTDGTFSATVDGTFTNSVKIATIAGLATAFYKPPSTLLNSTEVSIVGTFSTT